MLLEQKRSLPSHFIILKSFCFAEQMLKEQELLKPTCHGTNVVGTKVLALSFLEQKLFEQKSFQHLENFRFRICRPWKPRAGQPEHRDADSLHLKVVDHDGHRETVGGRKAGSGNSFSVLYNWIFIVNEVDTFKSNAQLIYWNTEINNYTIIKKRLNNYSFNKSCWVQINEILA